MPFSARQGFFFQGGVTPPPANAIAWYEYDRANYEPISNAFTGGTLSYSVLTDSKFVGNANRYRAAVAHPNGNIYLPPRSSASGMIEFDPSTGTSNYLTYGVLGSLTSTTGNYFHSGVLTESGNILCIPFKYDAFVQVDPVAGTATEFGTIDAALVGVSDVRFTGAVLAPNGNVICIPQNAQVFLDVDPVTETYTAKTYGIPGMTNTQKFFGGARSFKDDCIYCAPLRAGGVARIDTANNVGSYTNYGITMGGTNSYYGACTDKFGNVVILAGESGKSDFIINPDSNTAFTFNFPTTTYGGIQGADGNVYTTDKNSSVYKVDISGGNTSPGSGTIVDTVNQMAGCTATNGNVYIFPDASSNQIIEIRPGADTGISNFANIVLTPYMNPGRI